MPGDARYWFGSLASGMEDASGQQYMRNRYFDPKTGQFTQADPIGLGGGLNAYGFAEGDPISYSDPYGLCSTLVNNTTGDSQAGPTTCKMAPIVACGNCVEHPKPEGEGTTTYSGVAVNVVIGVGLVFARGRYDSDDGSGKYTRFGIAFGWDVSGGVELGKSEDAAMEGGAIGLCGGFMLGNACTSTAFTDGLRPNGGSVGVAGGPSELAWNGHGEVTNTWLKPNHRARPIPRTMAQDATRVQLAN